MYWIGLWTEVVVLNSEVAPISHVFLKTGFTVYIGWRSVNVGGCFRIIAPSTAARRQHAAHVEILLTCYLVTSQGFHHGVDNSGDQGGVGVISNISYFRGAKNWWQGIMSHICCDPEIYRQTSHAVLSRSEHLSQTGIMWGQTKANLANKPGNWHWSIIRSTLIMHSVGHVHLGNKARFVANQFSEKVWKEITLENKT